jgi:hypothetical protein
MKKNMSDCKMPVKGGKTSGKKTSVSQKNKSWGARHRAGIK